MDLLSGGRLDHLLPVFPEQDALGSQFRILGCYRKNVPLGDIGAESEKQVRRGEMEKMKGVGLEELAVMHQSTHFFSGWGKILPPYDSVHGLGGSQMMADRADSTKPLYRYRGFPIGPTLDKTFESAKFDNMEAGLLDLVFLIKQDSNLPMAFHPGDRFYNNSFFIIINRHLLYSPL